MRPCSVYQINQIIPGKICPDKKDIQKIAGFFNLKYLQI